MICYHHNDMDGKAAGFCVHTFKPNSIEDSPESYVMCGYEDKFDKHTDKDDVFIVDLSISDSTYPMLIETCRTARSVTWIDHHATSIDIVKKHKKELQSIKNLTYFVSKAACGAALTYVFLSLNKKKLMEIRQTEEDEEYSISTEYKAGGNIITTITKTNTKNPTDTLWYTFEKTLPTWLYYIDDYDTWKKQSKSTEMFILGTDQVNTSVVVFNKKLETKVFNKFWFELDSNVNSAIRYISDGKIISRYIHSRYKKEMRKTFEWKYNDSLFVCKNSTGNSWNFGSLIDRYDAAILFNYDGNIGKWLYSVYSSDNSNFNCKEFASKFGGGGHDHAAGFSTKMLIFTNKYEREEKDNVIFLGGTCNNSDWREEFSNKFKKECIDDSVELFNPVVDDWTEECRKKEDEVKKLAKLNLFVITPEMKGTFSIAEAVECSHFSKVFFAIINRNGEFDIASNKSFDAIGEIVEKHGGIYKNYTHEYYNNSIDKLVEDVIASL